jgi:hypothetical protein
MGTLHDSLPPPANAGTRGVGTRARRRGECFLYGAVKPPTTTCARRCSSAEPARGPPIGPPHRGSPLCFNPSHDIDASLTHGFRSSFPPSHLLKLNRLFFPQPRGALSRRLSRCRHRQTRPGRPITGRRLSFRGALAVRSTSRELVEKSLSRLVVHSSANQCGTTSLA